MADLSDRTEREKKLQAAIAAILLMMQRDWEANAATNFQAPYERFMAEVPPLLEDTYGTAAERLATDRKAPEPVRFRDGAADWSRRRARTLFDGIVQHTQSRLRGPVDQIEPETVFDESRAEGIATTETTRASTAGEKRAATELDETRDDGQTAVAYWMTERDQKVCPVCKKLGGKPESRWPPQFRFPSAKSILNNEDAIHEAGSGGPPAHPHCRCWIDWRDRPKPRSPQA